jgi:hypothetical protein
VLQLKRVVLLVAAVLWLSGCSAANKQPVVTPGMFSTEHTTSVRVCDDTPGRMEVRVREVRRVGSDRAEKVMARTINSLAPDHDCQTYNFNDPHPVSWVFGDFTYTYRVKDREGLWSKPARVTFRRGGE